MAEPLGGSEAWPAPGKLNLFLHVVGRREDGYHLLQTAFQFIDLADQIRFFERPAGTIERLVDLPGVRPEQDLTLRAASALAEHCGKGAGVAIALDKRLPVQGGVGGGSSDAATVLVALNELWGCGLPRSELMELARGLGADVPVFVGGRAAWAEGTGERLTPMDFPEQTYLLLQPDAGVDTAGVFQDPELTRDSPIITISGFLQSGGRNDCEAVVRRRQPIVAQALDWLAEVATARLTGTGSCVFAAMPDEERARAVLRQLPARWRGWVVHGLNRSPLEDRKLRER
ncbi:MAG TPA: 4-(cytidine 5'-diphospho)-2-C-methyl-D-erythritol kinase, partial [Steroidobacteraceae bacterium]|nr:4-(cytidine 5'-diphospho)-2-C-methyl-D-erythritol kinase [Steroidobacteraceae bacterium]